MDSRVRSAARRRTILGATSACAFGFLIVPIAASAAGRARDAVPLSNWDAAAVERARAGAWKRLLEPECEKLLDDFTDGRGRTLREKLGRLGLPAADYLQQLAFFDGSWTRSCESSDVLMVTNPGRAAVYVCPAGSVSRLSQTVFRNRAGAEFAVIHEMLHTLGLGENPPSSQQITARVARRCGGS
jgi:hypothetical protein